MSNHKYKPVKRSNKRQKGLQVNYEKRNVKVSIFMPNKYAKMFYDAFLIIVIYLALDKLV